MNEEIIKETAKEGEGSIDEMLIYCGFPGEHRTRIRTSNVIERSKHDICRMACGGDVLGWELCPDAALHKASSRGRHPVG